jgi:hypothetical protein
MIKGTVKKGVAVWRCTECGAEQPILQYIWVPKFGEYIDEGETRNQIDAFFTKHRLCKKEIIQTEIFTD